MVKLSMVRRLTIFGKSVHIENVEGVLCVGFPVFDQRGRRAGGAMCISEGSHAQRYILLKFEAVAHLSDQFHREI